MKTVFAITCLAGALFSTATGASDGHLACISDLEKGTDWSLGNAAWAEGSVICVDAVALGVGENEGVWAVLSTTADKLQKECCEQGIDQQTCLKMLKPYGQTSINYCPKGD